MGVTTPPYEHALQSGGLAAVSGRLNMPAFELGSHITRLDPAASAAVPDAGAAPGEPRHAYTAADFRRELARARRARKRRIFLAVVAVLAIVIAVAYVTVGFSFQQVTVASMEPALAEGQVVLVAGGDSFAPGTVIAYDDADGSPRFGRVVAEPGSWVSISSDGTVAVSEFELSRETAVSVFGANASSITSRAVPEGRYYVLGDAEQVTVSGLQTEADFVDAGLIAGRAVFSVWPITSAGPVA